MNELLVGEMRKAGQFNSDPSRPLVLDFMRERAEHLHRTKMRKDSQHLFLSHVCRQGIARCH
jgi:hypothetical protein